MADAISWFVGDDADVDERETSIVRLLTPPA